MKIRILWAVLTILFWGLFAAYLIEFRVELSAAHQYIQNTPKGEVTPAKELESTLLWSPLWLFLILGGVACYGFFESLTFKYPK